MSRRAAPRGALSSALALDADGCVHTVYVPRARLVHLAASLRRSGLECTVSAATAPGLPPEPPSPGPRPTVGHGVSTEEAVSILSRWTAREREHAAWQRATEAAVQASHGSVTVRWSGGSLTLWGIERDGHACTDTVADLLPVAGGVARRPLRRAEAPAEPPTRIGLAAAPAAPVAHTDPDVAAGEAVCLAVAWEARERLAAALLAA